MECGGEERRKSVLHTQRFLDHETHLSDLPFDVLKQIVFSAVKTSDDGPRDFARIRSVSKDFLRAAEDEDVLKAIKFDGRTEVSWRHGFSGHINGLAYRCAGAGNDSAHCLLAKEVVGAIPIILAKDRAQYPERLASATFFLSNFDLTISPEYKSYDCVPRRRIHHLEVVRTFFLECSPQDVSQWLGMLMRMAMYCKYFGPPQRLRLRDPATHEVIGAVWELQKVAMLFHIFKDFTAKLSLPSLEKELVLLDACVRAALEQLKVGVEINKRPSYDVLTISSISSDIDKLLYLSMETDRKVSELLRQFRETEKKIIMLFRNCKANVVSGIDRYFLGSSKPPKFHINDASAFEGCYSPVYSPWWQTYAIR